MAGTCALLASCALTGYFAFSLAGGGRYAGAIGAGAREVAEDPVLNDWDVGDIDAAIQATRRAAAQTAATAAAVQYLAFLGSWVLALVTAAALSVFLLGVRSRYASAAPASCPACPVRSRRYRLD